MQLTSGDRMSWVLQPQNWGSEEFLSSSFALSLMFFIVFGILVIFKLCFLFLNVYSALHLTIALNP